MGRFRRFLGFLALLFVSFCASTAFADYVCSTNASYVSCFDGRYLTGSENGNTCALCTDAVNNVGTQTCTYDCTASISHATSATVSDGSQTCAGNYLGSKSDTTGTEIGALARCSGCSKWGSCSGGTCKVSSCEIGWKPSSDLESCIEDSYAITYDLDGGNNYLGAPSLYIYGTGATINGKPTKTNHTFDGWCVDIDRTKCSMSQIIAETDTGAKTFYAKWIENIIDASVSDKSLTYTGSAQSCANVSVSAPSDDAIIEYNNDGGSTYSTTAPTLTNVGSTTVYYQITATNYPTKTGSYTCTMEKAENPIAISVDSGSTKYPNLQTFTVSDAQGAVAVASADEDAVTVSYSNGTVTMTPKKGDGSTVKITVTAAGGDNYNSGSKEYTLTLNPGDISATSSDNSKTYDGGALTCDGNISVTAPNSGYTIKYGKVSGTYNLDAAPTITNVAESATIYYQVSADNYATKTGSFSCTVNKAENPIAISVDSGSTKYPNMQTFTVSDAQGAVAVSSADEDAATVAISGTTVTVTPKKGDGSTVKITVTAAGGDNYNSVSKEYTLTLNPGDISATSSDNSKTYDGSALTCDGNISVTAPNSGYTIKYGKVSGTYNLDAAPTITNVADSTTIYYQITAANYTDKTGSFSCTVNKANNTLVLSATSGTMAYSATGTFNVNTNTSGGNLSVESGNTDAATVEISGTTVTMTSKDTYGTTDIIVTSAVTDNYNAASVTYRLTVANGVITLNNKNANTAGTTRIYQTYNTGVYLTSWGQNDMTTSTNNITAPALTGYTFGGYYGNSDVTSNQYIGANGYITSDGVSAAKAMEADGTWYAKWTANRYSVVYNSNKPGKASASVVGQMDNSSHVYDTAKNLSNNEYSLTGWTFNGWNTRADGSGNSYDNAESVVNLVSEDNGSITLYAQWTANTLTINYNGSDENSGESSAAGNRQTCTYDEECVAATWGNLAKTNMTFLGWTENDGGATVGVAAGSSIRNIISSGSITLYAVWEGCPAAFSGKGVENSVLNGVEDNMCRYTHICAIGFYNANHLQKITDASMTCSECTDLPADATWTGAARTDTCAWTCNECVMGANATSCDVLQDDVNRTCTYTGTCTANTFNPSANSNVISCTVCPINSFAEADNVSSYCTCALGHTVDGKVDGATITQTGGCKPIGGYKIIYVMNSGQNYDGAPTSYRYGEGVKIDGTPTRNGYSFVGWCNDSELNSCSKEYVIPTTATGEQTVYAKWTPNSYTVTFDNNDGTGTVVGSRSCVFDSQQCLMPEVSSLVYAGYNPTGKWCDKPNGTGNCYIAGQNVVTNLSDNAHDVRLYAMWEPSVFKITLVSSGATKNENQSPVYLKYTVAWYSDEDASIELTNLDETKLPWRNGYKFGGYMINGVSIIDGNGVLVRTDSALRVTTENTTANIMWVSDKMVCPAGYYYPGRDDACVPCAVDHWCPGGDSFETDSGIISGLNECPHGGISSGGIFATNSDVCYKNSLSYISATGTATGTQTCYYNAGTDKYDLECYNIAVGSCAAGYWLEAPENVDCIEVGQDYYSPEESLLRNPCPEYGVTGTMTTADSGSWCYKTVDYVATHGNGTQVCNWTNYDVGYTTNCREISIKYCAGGYYRATLDATDCVPVGYGAYSLINSVDKIPCPKDGKTDSQTSDISTLCYLPDYPFVSDHGSGVRYCNYSESTQDYTMCQTKRFTFCHDGYWLAEFGDEDCSPVGYGRFGPVVSLENNGYLTGRADCPSFLTRQGMTSTPISANAGACYMNRIACGVQNGSGIKQCEYDIAAEEYSKNCSECQVTLCESRYYLDDNKCYFCPENQICDDLSRKDSDENRVPDGEPLMCKTVFSNRYPYADPGSVSAGQCWGDCDLLSNVVKMIGRDYQGEPDTCEIQVCEEHYYLTEDKNACLICPENHICGPETTSDLDDDNYPDALPKTCAEISDGVHIYSPEGSVDPTQCYAVCEEFDIIGGRAYPKKNVVYYGSDVCEYMGMSDSGNPCQIQETEKGLACIEISCNPDYELVNGQCQKCNRKNATAYKENGNCLVAKCHEGYHPDGDQCSADVVSCVVPNAENAEQTWDHKLKAYGICMVTKCADGYHVASNACVPDVQVCDIKNGTGVRRWNATDKAWDECQVTSCKPGFTNNPRESNEPVEPSKKCGACKNTFGLNGQVAVSSWVSGCEIAACMYQGELYNLEDNKCVVICNREPDETGSMRWDDTNKKCIRDCKPGYKAW